MPVSRGLTGNFIGDLNIFPNIFQEKQEIILMIKSHPPHKFTQKKERYNIVSETVAKTSSVFFHQIELDHFCLKSSPVVTKLLIISPILHNVQTNERREIRELIISLPLPICNSNMVIRKSVRLYNR